MQTTWTVWPSWSWVAWNACKVCAGLQAAVISHHDARSPAEVAIGHGDHGPRTVLDDAVHRFVGTFFRFKVEVGPAGPSRIKS